MGAKEKLKHGDWIKMVESALPFGLSTANKLMAVASDERLRNSEHVPNLPSAWGTLYGLTRLPDNVIELSFENGAIHPKLERILSRRRENLPPSTLPDARNEELFIIANIDQRLSTDS